MMGLIPLLCLLIHAVAGALEGDDKLNDVFGQEVSNETNLTRTCFANIVGTGKGCYECYLCSDPAVERRDMQGKVKTEFQLFDNKCSKTAICCYSQAQNILRSGGANCGISNPDGNPRRVRNSLRSVLPGEYPWRAWIYSKSNLNEPLCAAVYIDEESRALMTSAYCVEPYPAESLIVRFSKDKFVLYEVRSVLMHQYFDSDTRYFDIAVIGVSFSNSLPSWVKPVCWSDYKVSFGSACIVVSSDDYYVNAIIPQQTKCVDGKIPLDESFICAVGPRNDYQPEFGGGLICPEQAVNTMYYTAYGISLYQSGNTSITVYTNVTFFHDWIKNRVNDLLEIP